jgi:hypothetical protein
MRNILYFKKTIKQNPQIVYLSLMGIGYLLMCLKIEFWPRYLVFILPVLILLIVNYFATKPLVLILFLISYLPWLNYNFFPNPKDVVEEWNQNINNKHYRDAYRLLDNNSQQNIEENDWLKRWESNSDDNLFKEPVLENNRWRINLKDTKFD